MLSCSTAENQIGTSHHVNGMLLLEEKLLISPFRLLRRSSLSQQQHNNDDDDNELLSISSLSNESESKKRKHIYVDNLVSKKQKTTTSIPVIKPSVELTTTPATTIASLSTKHSRKQQQHRFDLSCNIVHKIDRTEYEKEKLWYNKEELQQMKSNAKEIVRHFIAGNLDYEFNETNEYCFNDLHHNNADLTDNDSIQNVKTFSLLLSCSDIFEYQRGLEKYSMNDMTLYNRRCHILRSQSVVLLEQDIQRIRRLNQQNKANSDDDAATRISQLYQTECIPFVKWAQCLGQADSYISKWVS